MKSNDLKELTELFRRVNAGGPGQATATKLFESKAASLGLDSFTLFNTMQQGGALTVYQPAHPPAVRRQEPPRPQPIRVEPRTQTRTEAPSAGVWGDTIRFRLYCSASERRSAVAVFKKRPGDTTFDFQRFEDLAPRAGEGGAIPLPPDFPAELLSWGNAACPCCKSSFKNDKHLPETFVLCGGCNKPRCNAGALRPANPAVKVWRFVCICGNKGMVGIEHGIKLSREPEARPQAPQASAASTRPGRPAIEQSSPLPRLAAPPRGGR